MSERYAYSISKDGAKNFERRYGAKKLPTPFDEAMAYEMKDGRIRMFARSTLGELAESYSYDGGESFSEARLSGIDSPSSRFYVSRTPSGKVLLVLNDDRTERKNMTLCLSEDDGVSWKYKLCIDERKPVSYPDVDFFENMIYLTYDRERTGAGEILFVALTEEDIIEGRIPEIVVVSKMNKQAKSS
jgi:predicted neuraminidase